MGASAANSVLKQLKMLDCKAQHVHVFASCKLLINACSPTQRRSLPRLVAHRVRGTMQDHSASSAPRQRSVPREQEISAPPAPLALVGGRWRCFGLSCSTSASWDWPLQRGGSVRRRGLLSGSVECQTPGLSSGWRAAIFELWRRWFCVCFGAAVTSQRLKLGLDIQRRMVGALSAASQC